VLVRVDQPEEAESQYEEAALAYDDESLLEGEAEDQ